MTQKEALKVLINNSYVLSQETKDKLLVMVEKMTDEEIEEWGKLLAEEQRFVTDNKEEILAKIDSLTTL